MAEEKASFKTALLFILAVLNQVNLSKEGSSAVSLTFPTFFEISIVVFIYKKTLLKL